MLIYHLQDTEMPPGGRNKQQAQPQTPPSQKSPLNEGYLELQIKSPTGENLSGVQIQIVRERDNSLMFNLITDANGRTRRITLPTPEAATFYGEAGEVFFTNYTIILNYPNHATMIYRSVSIYVGSTSFLTLMLY